MYSTCPTVREVTVSGQPSLPVGVLSPLDWLAPASEVSLFGLREQTNLEEEAVSVMAARMTGQPLQGLMPLRECVFKAKVWALLVGRGGG